MIASTANYPDRTQIAKLTPEFLTVFKFGRDVFAGIRISITCGDQILVRVVAAEIRRIHFLTGVDDGAPDGAAARKYFLKRFAVAPADRTL